MVSGLGSTVEPPLLSEKDFWTLLGIVIYGSLLEASQEPEGRKVLPHFHSHFHILFDFVIIYIPVRSFLIQRVC